MYGDPSKGSQANGFLNPKWPVAIRFSAKRQADIGASGTLLSSAGLITAGGTLHVSCENLAYQAYAAWAWSRAAGFDDSRADGTHRVCSQHSWHVPFRAQPRTETTVGGGHAVRDTLVDGPCACPPIWGAHKGWPCCDFCHRHCPGRWCKVPASCLRPAPFFG